MKTSQQSAMKEPYCCHRVARAKHAICAVLTNQINRLLTIQLSELDLKALFLGKQTDGQTLGAKHLNE